MNIQFSYLYRDAGNFKNFGEIIFANPNNFSLEDLRTRVKQVLLGEMYFDAFAVGIPELFFEDYDEELDHDWHEFDRLDLVGLPLTDDQGRTIDDFFARLMAEKLK